MAVIMERVSGGEDVETLMMEEYKPGPGRSCRTLL